MEPAEYYCFVDVSLWLIFFAYLIYFKYFPVNLSSVLGFLLLSVLIVAFLYCVHVFWKRRHLASKKSRYCVSM